MQEIAAAARQTRASENWVGDLTEKQLRSGLFANVASLEKTALAYLDARYESAAPFT